VYLLEEFHNQIRTVHNRGLFAEAAEMARVGLQVDPDDVRLWEFLGIARHALREFPAAMEALEQATVRGPLSPAAELALAGCYLVLGRMELAGSMYRHLATRPHVPGRLLPSMAAGLLHVGEFQWAVEVQRRAALERPDDEDALYALVHYMGLAEYPPELIRPIADRVFRINPASIRNRVFLALVHHRLGDHQAGYGLLSTVDMQELLTQCCPCRLIRLASLFAAVGDRARHEACMARLAGLRRMSEMPRDASSRCPVARWGRSRPSSLAQRHPLRSFGRTAARRAGAANCAWERDLPSEFDAKQPFDPAEVTETCRPWGGRRPFPPANGRRC